MKSSGYSRLILLELELSGQIFDKYPNIKFRENPSSWSRFVPCGRTDRHSYKQSYRRTWGANSRFPQFLAHA